MTEEPQGCSLLTPTLQSKADLKGSHGSILMNIDVLLLLKEQNK